MLVEEIVQHFDAGGAQIGQADTVTYFQGPQGPLYRKSSLVTDPVWYVYDGLGSVVGEVNVNGNVTGSKLYDVYGATRSISGTPTSRQGFVGGLGHESDNETGLIYMRARYYDPLTGRFASEDPAGHGRNWYIYAADSPTNNVDPSGKTTCGEVEIASGSAAEAEGGGGTVSLWRGMGGQEWSKVIENGLKFLDDSEKDLYLTRLRAVGSNFAREWAKGTGSGFLTQVGVDSQALDDLIASGVIRQSGAAGVELIVPGSFVGAFNALYVAVQMVEEY